MRLIAATRGASPLIDAAHDFDGGGAPPDDVERAVLPDENEEGTA
jgi:hypothetical protein